MAILRRISQFIDSLSEYTGRAVAWLCLAVVFVGALNAVLRYIGKSYHLNLTQPWMLELQWYLFSAIFLLAAAYTLKHNAHVRVDALYDRFSPKTRAWVNLLGYLIVLIPFCGFMLWISWAKIESSWGYNGGVRIEGFRIVGGEQSGNAMGLPRYPVWTLMPIAIALLSLQAISEVLKSFLALSGSETEQGGKV